MKHYIGKFAINDRKYSIRISASNFIGAFGALTDFVASVSPNGKVINIREVV